jgi:hypothetical protein
MSQSLNRSELIELVRKIANSEGSDEIDKLISLLEQNVPHPEVTDLIFYPEDGRDMTPEEIIDCALSYKPIALDGKTR